MRFRAISLLVLAAICFITAQATAIKLFLQLSYLLMGLLVVSVAWAWLSLQGLRISREIFTNRAQVGEYARERLTLQNLWPLPRLWLEVRDYSDMPAHSAGIVTSLAGRAQFHWLTRTPCTLRGKYTLGPATVTSGDPFGIIRLRRSVPGTSEIIVYPATVDLPHFELPGNDLQGGQRLRQRTFYVTPNVATIRDYVHGDSFNRIHWRSTARTGRLIVKEFELDPAADINLVVDMQESVHQALPAPVGLPGWRGREFRAIESTEEYSVSAAASIARHLLRQNRTLGLIAWGQHRELIPPEREARQFFKILEALAVIRAYGVHPLTEVLAAENARFTRNSALIVVTSSLDLRWSLWLNELRGRGVQPVVVLVDPQSFGGSQSPQPVLARLAELGVRTYHVRQGISLAAALEHPL